LSAWCYLCAYSGAFGLTLYGIYKPGFVKIAWRRDDSGTCDPFGGPFRHRQGYKGPAKAENNREHQQVSHIQTNPLCVQNPIYPQNIENNAQNQDNSQVGKEKQHDSLHGSFLSFHSVSLLIAPDTLMPNSARAHRSDLRNDGAVNSKRSLSFHADGPISMACL
jgi:hypothetical protein